jgi:hypothetical protein
MNLQAVLRNPEDLEGFLCFIASFNATAVVLFCSKQVGFLIFNRLKGIP